MTGTQLGMTWHESMIGWIQWQDHAERAPFRMTLSIWKPRRSKTWDVSGWGYCPGRFWKEPVHGVIQLLPNQEQEYVLYLADSKYGEVQLYGKIKEDGTKIGPGSKMLTATLKNHQRDSLALLELTSAPSLFHWVSGIRLLRQQPPESSLSAEKQTIIALAETIYPALINNPSAQQQMWERLISLMGIMPFEARFFIPALYRFAKRLGLFKLKTSFDQLSVDDRIDLLDRVQQQGMLSRKLLEVLQFPLRIACYSDPEYHKKHQLIIPKAKIAEAPETWQQHLFTPSQEWSKEPLECDVVVVGSGAGGAVIAETLARHNLAVAIVEEGIYWDRQALQDTSFKMLGKLYRSFGVQRTEGIAPIIVPTGIGVGGTTLVNSGTSYRPPASTLKRWRDELGLVMLTEDMLDPYFKQVESRLYIQPGDKQYLGPIADVIAQGAEKFGYSHHPIPRNAVGCDGQGACATGCPSGAKMSTNVSYIPLALKQGASLFTGYRVSEILQDLGHVTGIRAQVPGFGPEWTIEIRAKCVVLAAGALVTPQILLENGISVEHPQLGRNLSIHPAINIGGLFPQKMQVAHYIPQSYSIDHFREEGLLFEGASTPPEISAITLPVFGRDFLHYMQRYQHYANFGFMTRDTDYGHLKLRPGKKPKLHYKLNAEALRRLTHGVKILGEVMFAGGAEELVTQVAGRARIRSVEELHEKYQIPIKAEEVNLSAYHPLGTCRIGISVKDSVISPDHEVWGTKNLFVVDGSAVPGPLGVNPQVTIMAMATRAGELIASRF